MSTISREYLTSLSNGTIKDYVHIITDKVLRVAKTTLEMSVTIILESDLIDRLNGELKNNYMRLNIPENVQQEKLFQQLKEKFFDSEIEFIKTSTYKMITIKW